MVDRLEHLKLAPGSKKPVAGELQISSNPEELQEWRRSNNLGLRTGKTNGIVVKDWDGAEGIELAREEFRNKLTREFFKCLVRTPSGGLHAYMRAPEFPVPNAVKVEGKPTDLRSDGGYVVAVGSRIRGQGTYEFIPGFELRDVTELPVFPEIWLPPAKAVITATREEIRDVAKYVMRVESKQGEGGSRGLVRACAICRDAGLSEAEATILLLEWNSGPTVSPSWSHEDLCRAITRTYAKGK